MTQNPLAKLLGITQPTLSAFMGGRQGSSVHVATAACRIDGKASIDEVLGFSSKPPETASYPTFEELPNAISALLASEAYSPSTKTQALVHFRDVDGPLIEDWAKDYLDRQERDNRMSAKMLRYAQRQAAHDTDAPDKTAEILIPGAKARKSSKRK